MITRSLLLKQNWHFWWQNGIYRKLDCTKPIQRDATHLDKNDIWRADPSVCWFTNLRRIYDLDTEPPKQSYRLWRQISLCTCGTTFCKNLDVHFKYRDKVIFREIWKPKRKLQCVTQSYLLLLTQYLKAYENKVIKSGRGRA